MTASAGEVLSSLPLNSWDKIVIGATCKPSSISGNATARLTIVPAPVSVTSFFADEQGFLPSRRYFFILSCWTVGRID